MHSILKYPALASGQAGPFAVNFTSGFLSRNHVKAYVEGELTPTGEQIYRTITWVNDGLIHLVGTEPSDTVVIQRTTPIGTLVHDYQDGAVLCEKTLDQSNLQALMVAQEAVDVATDLALKLTTEAARAIAAESEILSIAESKASASSIGVAVAEETDRAIAAEVALSATIQDEIDRAVNADDDLTFALDGKSPLAGPGSSQAFSVGALSASSVTLNSSQILDSSGTLYLRPSAGGISSFGSGAASFLRLYNGSSVETVRVNTNGVSWFTGGNVTIGTATDNGVDKLQVVGNASMSGVLTCSDLRISGNTNGLAFGHDASGKSIGIGWGGSGAANFGSLLFYNGKNGEMARMVGATGNVLIGTATDNGVNKLQVNGSASIAGVLAVSVNGTAATINGPTSDTSVYFQRAGTSYGALSVDTASFTINAIGSTTPLKFAVYGSERARITPTGNLLIGTQSEVGATTDKFQVNGPSYMSGALTFAGGLTPAIKTATSYLFVKPAADLYLDAGASSQIYIRPANSLEAMRFTSQARVVVGGGTDNGLAKMQVPDGITLGNTENANPTVLDWYEEGTWTPVANGLTVSGVPTYTGRFTRIGRRVFCTLIVSATTSTAATSGTTYFTGLPYSPVAAGVCMASNMSGANLGNGLLSSSSPGKVFVPAWTSTGIAIIVNFSYDAS